MIRALLINPPSSVLLGAPLIAQQFNEPLGAPLLGQQYVAASLLEAGCEVRVLDAGARHFPPEEQAFLDSISKEVENLRPHLIGFGLYTHYARQIYTIMDRIQECTGNAVLVAGGPHATVRPVEVIDHGFDVAVVGEAEQTVVELAEWIAGKRERSTIRGILFRDGHGEIGQNPDRRPMEKLDELVLPTKAQSLYNPGWYDEAGLPLIPGGILTSRGCPAKCIFCANYVTGRRFRQRSACSILEELEANYELTGCTFYSFWDDAFTINKQRVETLCHQLQHKLSFTLEFCAMARVDGCTRQVLKTMKEAGCVGVTFGVESGDEEILKKIGKGITLDKVIEVLETACMLGLNTTCTFMMGFPGESAHQIQNTIRFMERIAPFVDNFGPQGVVVPMPGTPLYELNHKQYGFTDWWLDEQRISIQARPRVGDNEAFRLYYKTDLMLEADFFHYDRNVYAAITEALRYKAEHNLRKLIPDNFSEPVLDNLSDEGISL